jgi:hypothetical protein
MKVRVVRRKSKLKVSKPTHEEQQIAAIFEDDINVVDKDIRIDPDPDVSDNTYEYVDYGLTKEESEKIWEDYAKEKAKEYNDYIIKVMASFDALQSAEDHVNKTFDVGIKVTTKNFVEEINSMLFSKFKAMFLADLNFGHDQELELFNKYISRVSKDRPNILRLVNEPYTEDSPYGALGVTRGLNND